MSNFDNHHIKNIENLVKFDGLLKIGIIKSDCERWSVEIYMLDITWLQ